MIEHVATLATVRPERGAVRHLRAMAASLACVATAFGAHVLSGGQTSNLIVVSAFVLSGATAWMLAGARLTSAQLLGLLVLSQVAVHGVSMASESGHPVSMGAAMLATHCGATVVSWMLLMRGETFVWAIARRLTLRPLRLLRQTWRPHAMTTLLVAIPASGIQSVLGSRLAPVRGPPTGFALVRTSL